MSESEFDRYLALLSGLLRLSPTQREEIASELRDHLEERLGELLARGVPRQQALAMALEEFGDAAGLAGEFARIFQRQRRRWMMRMTLGSAVVISVIALLASAFWPDGRPGPARQLVAQDKSDASAPRAPLFSPTLGEADLRAEANLHQRVEVDYLDQPLADVLQDLGFKHELQFHVKRRYLEDFGISTDVPVTISLTDVAVETALELILENLDLTYVIRDGVVLITTDEDFESVAEVRVYNCRDLLEPFAESAESGFGSLGAAGGASGLGEASGLGTTPGKFYWEQQKPAATLENPPAKKSSEDNGGDRQSSIGSSDVLAQFGGSMGAGGGGMGGGMVIPKAPLTRADQLMDIIQIAVIPESWESVGGPGTIGEFDGMIVIRHNPRAHRQVEQVLHMLRDASAQQSWTNPNAGSNFSTGSGGGFF